MSALPTVAISYIRVSSEQQAGETVTSLADQTRALDRLAERLGVAIVRTFSDPGVSGSTVEKRPGLRELLAYCRKHPRPRSAPGYVLVLNDSRFGRFEDPDEAAALRFELKRAGWIVEFAEGGGIADPSLRHIMRAVGGAQASDYLRNLRANAVRGRMGTARLGFWTTRAPFGYWRQVVHPPGQERLLPPGTQKGKGEKIKLTPGPEAEVALVRELFARYLTERYSLKALCRFATEWCHTHGISHRARWDVSTLRILLENDAYAGDTPGRRRTAERMAAGDWSRHAPEYVIADTHPPLIAREVFTQVRSRLAAHPIVSRETSTDYRVRNLVHCALCGGAFVGHGGGSKRLKATGERIWLYIDQHGRDGRCGPPAATIARHVLEGAIIRTWAAHVQRQSSPTEVRVAFQARLRASAEAPSTRTTLERERAQVQARITRLVDAVANGVLADTEVREQLARARAQVLHLDHQLQERRAEPLPAFTTRLQALTARAADLETLAANADGPTLRALLHPWIQSMTFDPRDRSLSMRLFTLSGALLMPAQPSRGGGRHKQDRPGARQEGVRIYTQRLGQAAKRRETGE